MTKTQTRKRRAFAALERLPAQLGPSQRGLLLAVAGLMIENGASDPSYVDVVTFFARHDLARLDAEFRAGRTTLLFGPGGLVVQRLASPDETVSLRDALPDGTQTLAIDLAGIVKLLRVRLGGRN